MSILDELLTYEDDRPGRHRQANRVSWWRLIVVIMLFAGIAAIGKILLRGFGWGISFSIAFLLLVALWAVQRMVRGVGAGLIPATLFRAPSRARSSNADYVSDDGIRDGIKHWEMRFDWTGADAARFAGATQPALIELIDERLRLRHAVDRAADPERARELLDPQLWKFVNEPVTRRPTARDLAALVAAMEAL